MQKQTRKKDFQNLSSIGFSQLQELKNPLYPEDTTST
jgi:hypothetical protein